MDEVVTPRERYLGEPVFCVGKDGRITRTIVSELSIPRHSTKKITGDGGMTDFMSVMDKMLDRESYSLLNQHSGMHYFSLDDAIADAIVVLEKYIARTDITKADEESARTYLAEIQTPSWRGVILSQPLIQVSQTVFLKDTPLNQGVGFPTEYFKPGETVFCLITPRTHYSCVPEWRPHLFFLLETTVITVRYAPGWPSDLSYKLADTDYSCRHKMLCRTEAEARIHMTALFEEETGGGIIDPIKLNLVHVSVEARHRKEEIAKLHEYVRKNRRSY